MCPFANSTANWVERGRHSRSLIDERLYGNQKRIDKNKNGRIDREDFKMLRGKKENKEGYLDMVGKAMNKNMMNKISDIRPGLKFESQLQSKIENLVRTIFNKRW